MSFSETTIENFDLNEEYYSAFRRSLNTEISSNRDDVQIKRRIYTCLKIERIDNQIELIKLQKIKESKDESNVIIAIDINDKTTDREPNILKENGPITVIEVCITSTKEMMTDTKLIKDIIKHPEKQIEEILQEWRQWRQWRQEKRDKEKKCGIFDRFSGLFTPLRRDQSHNVGFETILKQKQMEDQKSLDDMKNHLKVLLEKINNMEKEMERGNKSENMIEQYQLHVKQLNNIEEKVNNVKETQEQLEQSAMVYKHKIEDMQKEQDICFQKLKNIKKAQKEN